jgi:hypothetical protein
MEVTKGENIFSIEEDFRGPCRRAQKLCFSGLKIRDPHYLQAG